MSKIQKAFEKVKQQGRKAFIPFVTAGDPSLEATERFIYTLEQTGSDIIEIGIPFSDPIADGPVIQRANVRALENNVTISRVFDMVTSIRKTTDVPLVFLLYANTIYYYGIESFFKKCQETGIDGVIIPDLPFEEREEFNVFASAQEVDVISLVAPTSKERIKEISKDAAGFLYCVSSMGVTGTRDNIQTDLKAMFETIDEYCNIPTALGFGISSADQAKAIKSYADGVIVGSAIVKIIEEHGEKAEEALTHFAQEMMRALRN
ncbi:tryptophan synthase subunit alpha [Cellulosilyticum sp. I15G10I2]|uniref:tryptophan synthase subunit alpha n=1 Tax=Cellulosilyticum sp. I15G10I2 TaxID=1892843 RepID=UPI00085C5ABD|nr:tryptophan synthase subunit alpha [Cellulosilyticum sp. I15G10I2]